MSRWSTKVRMLAAWGVSQAKLSLVLFVSGVLS